MRAAAAWAAMHSEDALRPDEPTFGDTVESLAGPGAPGILEFSVHEFAAALGMSSEWGAAYLGLAIELRYRLPRTWARVMAGDLQAWRARRIAEKTLWLSPDAASFVDRHVAGVAHRIRPTGVDKLVEEAASRFDPDTLATRHQQQRDRRGVHLDTGRTSIAGTVPLTGELDLPDALALDEALAQGAADLAHLGSTDTLDVRRATALGDLARAQLPLDLMSSVETTATTSVEPVETTAVAARPRRTPKRVVLHLHLTDQALAGTEPLGRIGTTRTPVTADQIRTWCGTADQLVIKPVIDLNGRIHVNAYEVPDRLREHVALRDHACVFPWCTRPADTADMDHVEPFESGGETATDNIAPLCRAHHRAKTHGRWTLTVLSPGEYLWRSPHGLALVRDHTGTRLLTPQVTTPRQAQDDTGSTDAEP
jgi:hypothetical protein